jgi:hypothetical protein
MRFFEIIVIDQCLMLELTTVKITPGPSSGLRPLQGHGLGSMIVPRPDRLRRREARDPHDLRAGAGEERADAEDGRGAYQAELTELPPKVA